MTKLVFRLLLVGLMASACRGYGQDSPAVSHVRHEVAEPLYLLNSNTIVSSGFLPRLTPPDIASIHIYKPNQVPPLLAAGLASAGIIALTYKKEIASQSFAQISHRQGVRGPFRVILDGRPLSPEQVAALRVVPEAIEQVHITPATSAAPEAVVVVELTKATPVQYPPGTILIR